MKKLKTFHWYGIDVNGMRIHGINEYIDEATLKTDLKRRKISLLNFKCSLRRHQATIKSYHIVDFTRQLATLIQTGIALVSALQIISQNHENRDMKNLLDTFRKDIEAGGSLSEALHKYPRYFDKLYCNLIYAGEQSSTLGEILSQMADYQEKMFKLKNKIKKSLFYPGSVILIACAVIATLLIFVVPQFETLYHGFGAKLPTYTIIILKISKFIKHYILLLLIFVVFIFAFFKWCLPNLPGLAHQADRLMLKLPILGPIIIKAIVARFARTLATTFNAGLPLTESMQIIAHSTGNRVYTAAILKIRDQIIKGQSIHIAMENVLLFPRRVTQMLAVAEESATITPMLNKIAAFYEQEVDTVADNLNKLLEPAIIVILGILVGGLVIAMYLPIFRLGNVI